MNRVLTISTCSRCEKSFEREGACASPPKSWRVIGGWYLCPECYEDFETFMHKGEIRQVE